MSRKPKSPLAVGLPVTCLDCPAQLVYSGHGRPPQRCPDCRPAYKLKSQNTSSVKTRDKWIAEGRCRQCGGRRSRKRKALCCVACQKTLNKRQTPARRCLTCRRQLRRGSKNHYCPLRRPAARAQGQRAYGARRYKQRVEAGICACCGRRPSEPNRVNCGPCLQQNAARANARYAATKRSPTKRK